MFFLERKIMKTSLSLLAAAEELRKKKIKSFPVAKELSAALAT